MVKTKSKSLASKKVKRYTVESTRPGSGSSTRISKKALGPQELAREKEATQQRIDEALSGLGGRAIEHIRNAHAVPDADCDTRPTEDSYRDLQDAGNAMEVDDWEDEDDDGAGDVLHALRDFMAER
ncbi:hypothetical protein C2E23DRAFT_717923 [Lenzites betulinus]|nr:hypothetical protein C2E23DRAFT_742994 [Lenzites betulinus]KAH9858617.1 hypothetical protein C2E23DRAFT_717923 [Lenzites betulinus]